jgi:hypothetical protein
VSTQEGFLAFFASVGLKVFLATAASTNLYGF